MATHLEYNSENVFFFFCLTCKLVSEKSHMLSSYMFSNLQTLYCHGVNSVCNGFVEIGRQFGNFQQDSAWWYRLTAKKAADDQTQSQQFHLRTNYLSLSARNWILDSSKYVARLFTTMATLSLYIYPIVDLYITLGQFAAVRFSLSKEIPLRLVTCIQLIFFTENYQTHCLSPFFRSTCNYNCIFL